MRRNTSIRWNAYPALLLAGGFALGIWGATEDVAPADSTWVLAALVSVGLATVALAWPRRRLVTLAPLGAVTALGLAAVALGGVRATAYQALPPGHLGRLVPPRADVPAVTLVGRIAGAVEGTTAEARFTLQADTLVHRTDTLVVRGRVRVLLRPSRWDPAAPFPRLRAGDRLHLHGRLRGLPMRRNPADFDYGAYLQRRRIYALMTLYDPANVIVHGRDASSLTRLVMAARAHIDRQLRHHIVADEPRAVLRALLLGDRSQVTDATRERFVTTGLLHLLAISGLHVLLVGMVIYTLLRPLLMRIRLRWRHVEFARTILTLALLVGFALLTGARPSVVRAVVMATLLIGGNVLQRTTHPLNALGVAALLLLGVRPTALFDAGFQLSFAAVGGIVALNPRLRALLPSAWRRDGWRFHLGALVTVTVAATFGTMPVLLVHFGYVSFAGLVLNVPAIPLTVLALLSGLLVVAAGGWLPAAPLFGASAEALTKGLLTTASTGEVWLGWAAVDRSVEDPWVVLALVVALCALAQWPRPRMRWRLVAVTLVLASVAVWADALARRGPPSLDVLFFDVGQGDAALVTFPGGRHLLVDAGPRSPVFDAGASVILPHLRRYGIDRLDAVAISHPDSDHLGGLPTLLRQVPVGRVVLGRRGAGTGLVAETEHLLDSLAIAPEHVHAGDTLLLDPSAYVQVLAPPDDSTVFGSDNDASLVLRITYGDTRFLFTGDIERRAERWLVERFGPFLESDVIKVGHHGSSTSSTQAFVRRVLPDSALAVVSVGLRNPFGLPDPVVVQRWVRQQATVVTTAEEGAVWIRSDGTRVRRLHWRSTDVD